MPPRLSGETGRRPVTNRTPVADTKRETLAIQNQGPGVRRRHRLPAELRQVVDAVRQWALDTATMHRSAGVVRGALLDCQVRRPSAVPERFLWAIEDALVLSDDLGIVVLDLVAHELPGAVCPDCDGIEPGVDDTCARCWGAGWIAADDAAGGAA